MTTVRHTRRREIEPLLLPAAAGVLMRVYLALCSLQRTLSLSVCVSRLKGLLRLLLVFVPCSPAGPDLASPSRLADVKDLSIITTARPY
jgi:hypothetical protein